MSLSCKRIRHSQLQEGLPPVLADLLPDELKMLSLQESDVDCSNCSMLDAKFARNKGIYPYPFSEFTKCCTYYPFVPNFMVGQILKEELPGASVVRDLIRERSYVLPLGLFPPPGYQSKFKNKASGTFGTAAQFSCPFYNVKVGGCQIWKSRGSQCSTFFCTSSFGGKTKEFWQQLQEFLHQVEMLLSQEAMIQFGFLWPEVESNLAVLQSEEQSYFLDSIEWSKFWAHRLDSIEDYFCETYDFVANNKASFQSQALTFASLRELQNQVNRETP